jgi:hypothetical protein
MQKLYLLRAPFSILDTKGVAAYSGNPAETALRGVEVASNRESGYEKIPREF